MSKRPRKGRPVAFAPITPARAQPDPVLGLKFTIEARHGGTVLVDMTVLDPRPLAIAFAGALRPESWPTRTPSRLLHRLTFPGRHSLIIYLVHQPILFGCFNAWLWLTAP